MQRFLAIAGVCLGLSLSAAAQQQPIRVHCGGGAYTDSKGQLISRCHRNVAAVALANKLARMAWAVLAKNEPYRFVCGHVAAA